MENSRLNRGACTSQIKLPPIRRRYDIAQKPMLNNTGDDNFSSHFPRLPRIERSPFGQSETPSPCRGRERNQHSYLAVKEQFSPFRQAARKCERSLEKIDGFQELNKNEKAIIRSEIHRSGGMCRENNCVPKNEIKLTPIAEKVFQRPVHLLRRRLKPDRVYQHRNGEMSHEELLVFDQNMDKLRTFTERDVKWIEVKDFNGKRIDPKKTGNGDITSYIEQFDVEGRRKGSRDELPLRKETKVRVQDRFHEALDLHFYHYYRNTHPRRRMAICEEIERSILIDDVALTCYREHLSLQEVINTWVV